MRTWRRHHGDAVRPRTRLARALAASAAALLALAVTLGVIAQARLRQGPVPVDFVAVAIEAAAARELPADVALSLSGAALSLGDAGDPRPGLRLHDLRVVDAHGAVLVAAPMVRVDFRPLDLLAGRLRPTAVTLSGVSALLTRDPSGRFSLGLGAPAGPAPEPAATDAAAGGVAAAIAALAPGAPGPLESLRAVSFADAHFVYADGDSGRVWRAESADVRLTRDPGGALRGVASLTLPGGALGPVWLRAEGERLDDGGASLRLNVSGASTVDLAAQFPALRGIEALEAPLQGRLRAAIDGTGRLTALDATLRAGAGTLSLPDGALALAGAGLDFGFDPASGRFDVRRLRLDADRGALDGRATLLVARDADGALREATAQIDLDTLRLDDPALLAAPQTIDAASATLRVRTDPLRMDLADAHVAIGAARLDLSGAAQRTADGWAAQVRGAGRDLTAAQLAAFWPTAAAPGARAWIAENLEAGLIDRVDVAGRFGPDGPALGLTFAFRDARAHYFRPLPPIEDAAGWGSLDLERFTVMLDAGRVRPPGGGEIDVAGSVMTLPDLDDPLSRSEVTVRGSGPLAAILETLDQPPLGFPGKLGLDPRSVAGSADAVAQLGLPLLRDLLLDQISVDVAADLADVDLVAPGLEMQVAAQALTLRADTARLRVTGDAVIGGVAATVDWTETFSPPAGAARSAVALKAQVAAEQAAALGLDPRPYLTGAMGVTAALGAHDGGAVDFTVDLDLAQAALSASPLLWSKPAGEAASARIVGRSDGDGVSLSRLDVAAPGLSARGSLRLDGDGGLRALDLSPLRVGSEIDLSLSLARGADGLAGRVEGKLLDLSAFGDAEGGEDASAAEPVALDLRLETLRIDRKAALSDVAGTVRRRADGSTTAALTAQSGGAVRLDYDDAGGAGRVRIAADNAGSFLRGLDLFSDGLGGALEIDALRGPGGALSGELRIDDLVVADDPALMRLLTEAQIADRAREGLRFDRIRAPFVFAGGTVTLTEAVAYGPVIGLTIGGAYDVEADVVDMSGVFSPLFTLNALLGRIPVLGDLLTGGEGRGVVAFNFTIKGDAADPSVWVNPLSVLTPGVLRRLLAGEGAAPTEAGARRDRN